MARTTRRERRRKRHLIGYWICNGQSTDRITRADTSHEIKTKSLSYPTWPSRQGTVDAEISGLFERYECPYHFSLRLFTMVRRSSCGLIACWILAHTSSLVTWSFYEMRSILRYHLISMARILFFAALLRGSIIPKHTGRCIWKERAPVGFLNWEKCLCRSKLVSTLSTFLSSLLSWRVSQAWNPRQVQLTSVQSYWFPLFVEMFSLCSQ